MESGFHADSKTVSGAIAKLQESLRVDEAVQSSGANNNVVILHESQIPEGEISDLLQTFTEAHPSRFFVISQDDSVSDFQAHVTAICHEIGNDQKVCSEVIRAKVPGSGLLKLSSMLRANFVSGRPTEFFLYDDYAALRMFPYLSQSADLIFIDSSHFKGGLKTVRAITDKPIKVIDLQWARLTSWRDSIRSLFDKSAVNSLVPKLSEIRIKYERTPGGEIATAALLLGGWMVHQLGLKIMMYSGNSLYVRGSDGRVVSVVFEECFGAHRDGLELVELKFAHNLSPSEEQFVRFRTTEKALFTESSAVSGVICRQLEDESDAALIKRFYLIGESIANFGAALRVALYVIDANRDL